MYVLANIMNWTFYCTAPRAQNDVQDVLHKTLIIIIVISIIIIIIICILSLFSSKSLNSSLLVFFSATESLFQHCLSYFFICDIIKCITNDKHEVLAHLFHQTRLYI